MGQAETVHAPAKPRVAATPKAECPICRGRRVARFFQFDSIWCNPQYRGHQAGEDGGNDVLTEEGYREWIARCADCGGLFREMRIDFASLEQCYAAPGDYELADYRRRVEAQRPALHDPASKYRHEADLALSVIDPATRPSVLDIGCREGTLALGLQDAGCRISVCEPNRSLCAVLAQDHGFDVRATTFRPGLFDDGRFDLVIALEVLHRVDDPAVFLDAVWDVLRPGGAVMLGTNNQYALTTNYVTQQHRTLFSRASLEILAARCGFEVTRVETQVMANGVSRMMLLARKRERPAAPPAVAPVDVPWRQWTGLARIEFDLTPPVALPDGVLYPVFKVFRGLAGLLPKCWVYRAAGVVRATNRMLRRS